MKAYEILANGKVYYVKSNKGLLPVLSIFSHLNIKGDAVKSIDPKSIEEKDYNLIVHV